MSVARWDSVDNRLVLIDDDGKVTPTDIVVVEDILDQAEHRQRIQISKPRKTIRLVAWFRALGRRKT